jgi:hypothetical protein
LKAGVFIELMMAMSSTTSARCGSAFGQFRAALAMPGKFEAGGEQGRVRLDEGVALVLDDFLGNGLAVVFGQAGAMVEQIQLTGAAGLKKVNDPFGPRGKLGRVRGQRVPGAAAKASLSRNSEARASAPKPTPHWRKK